MKQNLLILFLMMSILILNGCSTTYKIDQTTYDDMINFLKTDGNDYLKYIEKDESLSKRDKFTKETKYNYFKNLIIEIGK